MDDSAAARTDDGATTGAPDGATAPAAGAPVAAHGPERRSRRVATHRASRALKARYSAQRSWLDVFSDWLTRVAASTPFLVAHAAWFGIWIAWNVGAFGLAPFDPFPFGLLTMIVSLEAIFLAIFVLMTQNREAAIAELREEITLQVNLRIEEEVTKTLQLLSGLYRRLGFSMSEDAELRDMIRPLDPALIEQELLAQIEESRVMWRRRA